MINRQYEIIKKIGEGRSKVLLCRNADLDGKEVAVKILPLDSQDEERKFFKNEFLTLRNINHPNIIKSFDYGVAYEISNPAFSTYEGSVFFVLEYFEGVELLDFTGIKDEKILTEITRQLCEALFYLHQSGYVHYDLKPENILVSSVNGRISLKLVDLGFTTRKILKKNQIKGTAEYIAPELLRGEEHDHRADLYSLGIILYRILYGKFPFDTNSELEIYKAQLEQEFDFPENGYSAILTAVLKRLLRKNPGERYFSSLEVIHDLGYKISQEMCSDFLPVKCFAARKDVVSILKKYVQDKTSTEIFNIMGAEGAGKSSLFQELAEVINRAVLIENLNRDPGLKFIKKFLKKVTYSEFIYPYLTEQEKAKFHSIINDFSTDVRADIRSYLILISLRNNFTVLLDDFDSYDDFTQGIMGEIMPILQSNNIKIIINENSDHKSSADALFNRREIFLSSFMESELTEFLEMSYGSFFPKAELKKAILLYADLLPGNIETFIKDLLLFKIIRYSPSEIKFELNEENEKLLKSSHEEIYQVRVNQLTPEELDTAKLISCFKLSPDIKIVAALRNKSPFQVAQVIDELQKKNILLNESKNPSLIFSSSGMKEYVYSIIDEKSRMHLFIGKLLEEKFISLGNLEIARQFEMAGAYDDSHRFLRKEIDEAQSKLAFGYVKTLLQHLLQFPLNKSIRDDLKLELANVMYTLSDYKTALEIISEFQESEKNGRYDAYMIKGGSLIGIGDLEKGVSILKAHLQDVPEEKKPGLLLSIASAEFDQNNFSEAENICNKILESSLANVEEVGKSLNLLGLIKIYTKNDFDRALHYFAKAASVYTKGKHYFGLAQMQNNIANIYNMKGDFEKAENYWNKSLKINLEIGNLEQEGTLLLNFGVLYFEKQDYERCIHYYKRALSIYSSLGNKLRENIVQVNLGEIYLVLCEYQEALSYLESAAHNLNILKNPNEEAEALYLLCRFYLIIGDKNSFDKVFQNYDMLHDEQNLLEKNQVYLRYLEAVSAIRFGASNPEAGDLRLLQNYFLEQKEKLKFLESSFYIISLLIQQKKYSDAFLELNSPSLIENCHNMSAEAERYYFLAIVASEAPELKLEPAMDYLQTAYDLIKEMNVNEFTWKILFLMAVHFHQRGNYLKCEEFTVYCNSLIQFLSENIKDEKLRNVYLNEPERKLALEKLKKLEA